MENKEKNIIFGSVKSADYNYAKDEGFTDE